MYKNYGRIKIFYRLIYNEFNKGRKANIVTRIFRFIRNWGPIATVIAIPFLIYSIIQANRQLGISQQNIASTDSTIVLMNNQILLLKENIALQEEFKILTDSLSENELLKYLEENKPQIYLMKVDCEIDNNNMTITFNYRNTGKSTAKNVKMTYILNAKGVITEPQSEIFGILISERTIVSPYTLHYNGEFALKVDFNWEWEAFNIDDSSTFYKIVSVDSTGNNCSCRSMDKLQAAKIFNF